MPRSLIILTALVIVTGGCRSPRYNTEDQPSSEPEPAGVPVPPESTAGPHEVSPAPLEPVSEVVLPSHVVISVPWVSVPEWARQNQLDPVRRISMSERPVFEVRSDQGTFDFQTGTRQARFDGMVLLLGFEPRMVAGEPQLHDLDLERNLEPLLLNTPFDAVEGRVIVIDPGHGGGNTGTRSAAGDLEKDYTLDWALRLQPLLETNGWTVLLTRTGDAELTLTERVAFAEEEDADLFISLHFNASGGGTHQAGVETYCLTPKGMPSNLTRGFEDDLAVEYPNNTFDTQNLRLAVGLHQALLAVNGGEDRGIRRARFMGVLRGQNRPAVLVEGGFLSSPQEAANIADPDYRQTLAEAIAAGVGTWAETED